MNFGLGDGKSKPVEPAPVDGREPATLSELRQAIAMVDAKLVEVSRPGRGYFYPKEMTDLLLDVRSVLDRLSTHTALVQAAIELAGELKPWEERLRENPGS